VQRVVGACVIGLGSAPALFTAGTLLFGTCFCFALLRRFGGQTALLIRLSAGLIVRSSPQPLLFLGSLLALGFALLRFFPFPFRRFVHCALAAFRFRTLLFFRTPDGI
jgi:hypothetical protein